MAREGSEWRSPIFDIGSANPTPNIIHPREITRKSRYRHTHAIIKERPASGVPPSDDGYLTYQPRISIATDSMKTAVETNGFEESHVGKHTAAGQLAGDPSATPSGQVS